MTVFFSQLINGLSLGSIYALIALGYSMVYGIILLLNFAHGDVIMVGAYMSWFVMNQLGLGPVTAVCATIITCTLLGVVLNVGASLYHLGIRRGEEMPFVTLFDGFAFVGKIILLYVVQVIFISLWTLLLVIPGIVAAYRYRFAMLNLCENPEIGVMEALNMSKAQTLGFKWQLFVLDLSFIGWSLLASLTLGILDIWVAPYRAQANIAFFQEIKKIKGVGFFPPRPEDDDQFRPHNPFGEDNW